MSASRLRTPIAIAIFFASGAAAVVFETLWFHQARLALGSSVWASALVPAAFMAGLGLGNGIAMRRGDRVARPLRAYAALEVVVAVSGVLLVLGLPPLGEVLAPLFRPWLDAPLALAAARLSTAFVVLVLPSTAMGLTLPLLVRALAATDPSFGRVLGRLYGWNTLGAVAGALVAEALLIGALGIRGTALVAGATNLAAASIAWLLARGDTADPAPTPAQRSAARDLPWRKLAAACLAGASLLALEVVWVRFLALYVLAVSLAFAVMLALVLAGIGLGGLAASLWLRIDARAHRFLTPVALGAGVLVVITYALFPAVRELSRIGTARSAWEVAILGAPLMMPVSLASGMLFTMLGAGLRAQLPGDAQAAALLTLANTAGAALGAALAAAVLLPLAGMERALFALALSYGASALLLFTPRSRGDRALRSAERAAVASGALYVVAVAFFPFGAMQRVHFAAQLRRWSNDLEPKVVVREGASETIFYVERQFEGETRSQRLVTNGFSMSSSTFRDRRYMKLFVYLPVAVHPAPRDALLICFGVGATAKALTDTRELTRIDVVDVSRDVLDLSRVVYPDPSRNPLHDARVRTHVEDGRFYLEATDRRYDLITGEPPPPNLDGVEALYSAEYFRLLRERLRDGGIVSYWLPTHSLVEKSGLAVVRAFCDAFDDCSVWNGFGTDLMLVGTRVAPGAGAATPVSDARFRAQWDDPQVQGELRSLGFERPEQLGALFMGDAAYLRELTRDVAPVVDDFPRRIASPDPFFAPYNDSGVGLYGTWSDAMAMRARFESSPQVARLWPAATKVQSLAYFPAQVALNRFAYRSSLRLADNLPELHAMLTTTTLEAPVLWMLGSDPDVQRIVAHLPEETLARPEVAYHVAARALSQRRFDEAATAFHRSSANRQLEAASLLLQMVSLRLGGRADDARAALEEATRRLASDGPSLALLHRAELLFP